MPDDRRRSDKIQGLASYGSITASDSDAGGAAASDSARDDSPFVNDDDDDDTVDIAHDVTAPEQGASSRGNTCATRTLRCAIAMYGCLMRVATGNALSVGERFAESEHNDHYWDTAQIESDLNESEQTETFKIGFFCCGPCCFRRHSHRRLSVLLGPLCASPLSLMFTLVILIGRVVCCGALFGRRHDLQIGAEDGRTNHELSTRPETCASRVFQSAVDVVRLGVFLGVTYLTFSYRLGILVGPYLLLMAFALPHSACVAAWLHEPTVLPASGCCEAARPDLLILCHRAAPSVVLMSNC
jgi:hypothetical protein